MKSRAESPNRSILGQALRDDSEWLFPKARFRHSDKGPDRNLDAIASRLFPANREPFKGQPVPLLF
ncbi:hypothetical protein, partial [Mesotoga sp.]|uniref:hypothetical protein n=1 Tax=Mesotoga sp. TaxID=2053577 RepID=UPI003566FAD0